MLALILALQQGPPPTVGDTVWITRTFTVAGGVSVRPRPIAPGAVVQPLAPPEIALVGDEVRLRYAVVAWRPGRHTVEIPGVILVRRDGWSDTLPAATQIIEVVSVLPPGRRDTLAPKAPAGFVARSRRSPLPAVSLLVLALVVLLPLHWRWRRRGPAAPPPQEPRVASPGVAVLTAWAAAGEFRAAFDGWQQLVSTSLATRPDVAGEVLLARLRQARYQPADPAQWLALCASAAAWATERGVA
jgi:hypothetical protein